MTDRRIAERVVRSGSAFLTLLGCAVLAGWAADIHFLKAITGHNVTMKANTAICFILVGMSSWFAFGDGGGWRKQMARVLALMLLALGGATLSQHLVGWNLGIDELLFNEPVGQRATTSPGRMGIPASLSFTLGGIGLLLTTARGLQGRGAQWFGFAILMISLLPLLGYLIGAEQFYGVARLTGIAPHTAVGLLIFGTVQLFQHYDSPPTKMLFDRTAGGELARRVLPAALLLPPLLGWIAAMNQQHGWVDNSFARASMLLAMMVIFTLLILATSMRLANLSMQRDQAEKNAEITRARADRLAAQNIQTLNLLEAMLENAPVGIAFFDPQIRYVRVNEFLAKLNGVPVADHEGRTIEQILPGTAWGIEPLIRQVFQTGQTVSNVEVVGYTRAMPTIERTWLNSLYPIRDGDGKVAMVGAVAIEITDRKRFEEQRTKLLESERAARAEAEHAGTLKDEFLATLSHELRTPLSAITGWASILKRKQIDDPDVREGIEIIDRNARVQIQLVNDLLDVSRIISGKLRLDVQPVDLPAAVEAAIAVVTPSAEAKGVRLMKLIDPQATPLNGDPARIQQIVWNLLSNAVKFTPKGGKVEVRLQRVNSHIEITVNDTGIGIKPEFLPYLFERFRQADSTTTRQYGGLGLGLSIVRQLTEMHGGTVRVISPGVSQGATFVVALPLSVMHVEPNGTKAHPAAESLKETSDCERTPLEGVRALVVDDQPDARTLIARLLEECNATVHTSGSADEAMEALDSFNPTILISDIGMPVKDGYELIRQVRKRFDSRALPAIALTAFARSDDRRRTMLAGFQLHISKPVDAQEIIAAVATLSGRTGGPRQEDHEEKMNQA